MSSVDPFSYVRDLYRVYNRDGSSSEDFSGLHEAQVILIAERHDTLPFYNQEEIIIQKLAGNSSCLLLEGLQPGDVLQKERFQRLKSLPANLEARGGDIRGIDGKGYEALDNSSWDLAVATEVYVKSLKKRVSALAAILKRHATTFEVRRNSLSCPTNVFREIKAYWDNDQEFAKVKSEAEDALVRSQNSAKSGENPFRVVECNIRLLQEINSVRGRFAQIFVIIGKMHLVGDLEFYENLRNMGLKVVTLLPKVELDEQIEFLDFETIQNCPKSKLFFSCGKHICEVEFPTQYEQIFHSQIRSSIVPFATIAQPLVLTAQHIEMVFKESHSFKFCPNVPVRFSGIDFESGMDLLECAWTKKQIENQKYMTVLNRFLFFSGLSAVLKLDPKANNSVDVVVYKNNLCLQFLSDQNIPFIMRNDYFKIDAGYFFYSLKRQNSSRFVLGARKMIEFSIEGNDAAELKSGANWIQVLSRYCPPGWQFTITGDYQASSRATVGITAVTDVVFHLIPQELRLTAKRKHGE